MLKMKFREKQNITCVIFSITIVFILISILYFIVPHYHTFSPTDSAPLTFPVQGDGPSTVLEQKRVGEDNEIKRVKWPPLAEYSEESYPKYRSLLEVVSSWNPDLPDPPETFVETLQHFNYSDPIQRKMAERYRDAEVPFKLYDIPEIDEVTAKWNKEYISNVMRESRPHVEKSKSNHFMYWTRPKRSAMPKGFVPPTELVSMSFNEWDTLARQADQSKLNDKSAHYYFMVGSQAGDHSRSFVARDLPFYSTSEQNFFITNPSANKGIQCRFAMRGIISECHYDSGKNMVAMIHGAKRYILTPPSTCKYLGIISDKKHPSYRHSIYDWSDIEQAKRHNFDQVNSIDTIIQTGEILYIPSFWFHYIIATNYAVQCNSRSGFPIGMNGVEHIEKEDCMNSQIRGTARAPIPNKIN